MQFDIPENETSIIKVIGVGGGGSNAVNYMYKQGIKGVDFIICNTDQQALDTSPIPTKVQLGYSLTEGRGAGSIPEVGKNAAIENIDEIKAYLENDTKMVFITAGMGGGTGTGAAPIIANIAKEMGVLTVGIITIPFSFEGKKRKHQAELGIEEMRQNVDTLIIICNDRLREMYGNLSITDAFSHADEVLATAAKGIAEIITVTGSINVDFEDVRTVMRDSGVAIMGSSKANGENRAMQAVEQALSSPLLNDNNIEGANYILLNITYGNQEIQMDEVVDVTDYIQEAAGSSADVIWGHGHDENLGDEICVTIIATGFKSNPDFGYSFDREPEKTIIALDGSKQTGNRNTEKRVQLEDNTSQQPEPTEPVNNQNFTKTPDNDKPFVRNEDFEAKKENEFKAEKKQRVIEFNLNNPNKSQSNNSDDIKPFVRSKNTPPADEQKLEITKEEQEHKLTPEEQQQLIRERINKLKKLSMKLKAPNGLAELEKEPAYKRREIELDDTPHSSKSEVSRYTLSEEDDPVSGEKKYTIKPNNSFLHDNVD